ncbi:hypothetical protein BH09PSE6_BH09PSE6_20680 [soil metagenome]
MNSIGTDSQASNAVSPAVSRPAGARLAGAKPTADPTSTTATDKPEKAAESKPVKTAELLAEQMNQMLERRSSQIRFEIDRTTHPSVVITQIVDKETKEVLRQFPSEELIRISESFDDAKMLGSNDVPLVKAKA